MITNISQKKKKQYIIAFAIENPKKDIILPLLVISGTFGELTDGKFN
tara:strand:+ start:476 stop:616 length:141 start_codon:yes stop_codon:yes gene_type:complete